MNEKKSPIETSGMHFSELKRVIPLEINHLNA